MENKDSKDILPTKFAKWATKNNWKWDDYLGTNVWWKHNPDSIFRKERTTDELWEIFLKEMNIEANQALESSSSEERVKQLEEENETLKRAFEKSQSLYESQLKTQNKDLEEENTRLKGLFKDCHEHGEKYGVFETIKRYAPDEGINPDFLKFEDWCNKNNIKL